MRVLIVDLIHEILIEKFEKRGFKCDYLPNISKKEIFDIIQNYEGIIIRSKIKLTSDILERAENLKFIGRVGAGLESIDLDYATKKAIVCVNSPEGNRDSVGEHAVGLLLSLLHKINQSNLEVKNGIWQREPNRGTEIWNKTVGIIGYGNMGSAFAKRLQGFDCKVISYDKYKTNYSDGNTIEVNLEQIFEQADILSLHTPFTDETKYMINNEFIQKFNKNIYIINTARGKSLNTKDLIENLKTGKVLGAGLDVLEWESVSFEEIFKCENQELDFLKNAKNVILTPHLAGLTKESYYKLSYVMAEKILNLF